MTDDSSNSGSPPSAKRTVGLFAGENSLLPEWARPLTPRQLRFVQEYLIDLAPRQAALRAGLSSTPTGASTIARNLLREPEVRQAIDAALAEGLAARMALRERIMQEVSTVAFYDIGDFVKVNSNTIQLTDTDELTEDQRRAVKAYKQTTGKTESIEVTMHDKIGALKLLNDMNGGSPRASKEGVGDVEVSGPVTVVFGEKGSKIA